MPNLSKQKKNKLLNITPAYLRGEKTLYQVAKECNVRWHTAKKWMRVNSALIKGKEAEIVANITNEASTGKELTIWEKIRKAILKSIITEA